jgi:dTDP-glucose 4,6-dehydratase
MVVTRLLQEKKVLVHGEGKEIREWIYVEDCCRALEKIVLEGAIGEVYNIGSGDRRRNIDVVKATMEIVPYVLGDAGWTAENKIKFVANRPGNDIRYAIDSSKFVNLIGGDGKYFYIHEFEEALEKTIRWYVDNPWFWERVNLEANIYSKNEGYLR